MTVRSPVVRGILLAGIPVLSFVVAAPAQAQGTLTATYTISAARIPIGKVTWSVDIGEDAYTSSGSGEASGIASLAISGKGTASVHGSVKDGALEATSFSADITRGDEKSDMTMLLDHGTVKEIKAQRLAPGEDRVPVVEANRQNIVDPLTAWLIPASDGLSRTACEHTLPVFDGQRRYDLKLSFKRMDKTKTDKGYEGPVAVCSVGFQPIAGHRASSTLVKYLSQGRDIELWLAPVAGTRMLAPIRLSLANMLGNLVVQASEFVAAPPLPGRSAQR
jgi:Protein of unknown function (DUF3108)